MNTTNEGRWTDQAQADAASANGKVQTYRDKARQLFEQEIYPRWISAENVWRTAWAMDTILDYFAASGVDSRPYGVAAIGALDPTQAGNWWDDFGWIGIAALRAAEQGFAPQRRDDFLKIAINAWAYMYGPGWSLQPGAAIYPFRELPGWGPFADGHPNNIGAPNVGKRIGQTRPNPSPPPNAWMMPRRTPGGAWNSPITANDYPDPVPSRQSQWWRSYLNPVQNTVTNGLYALLSLRLHRASRNPAFASVFRASALNASACASAWSEQIVWFDQWMVGTPQADQSLLMALPAGALVRERVSTFQPVGPNAQLYWDAMYRSTLAWTGDQGLLLGALREAQGAWPGGVTPKVLGLYPGLIEGVFKNAYQPRNYGAVSGDFPMPWLDTASASPYDAPSPGNDDGDYQTGVGVFMRYLLQAWRANPMPLQAYRAQILANADAIVEPGFGEQANPGGACDAFTPRWGSVADTMTAYVNRLSVLVLAIAMAR